TDWVNTVAFSPDGKTALSCSHDKTVRLWELVTGKVIHELTGHSEPVGCAVFSPDGKRVFSGAGGGGGRLRGARSGQQLPAPQEPDRDLLVHAAFLPDGKRLVWACEDSLCVWDSATGSELATMTGPKERPWAFALSADGKRVLSAHEGGTLALWDTDTGAE